MLLSAILKHLSDESDAVAALLDLGDLVLVGEVEAVRLQHQESVGDYVIGATRRFAGQASDADWLRLTTALEGCSAPASACLHTMLTWAVAQDRSTGAEARVCNCTARDGVGSA
jgi:hypothetical protein